MSRPRNWPSTCCKGILFLLSACQPSQNPAPELQPTQESLPIVGIRRRDLIQEAESLRKAFVAYTQPRVGWLRIKATYRYRETRLEGSAWYWMEHGVWVTCAHLFPQDKPQNLEIELWDAQGGCRMLSPTWIDSLADVAFLRDTHSLGLIGSGGRPEVGDWCFAMGAPLGLSFSFEEGYLVASRQIRDQTYYQLALWAAPGSSGSPVLNRNARLIAMISEIADLGNNDLGIAFALPYRTIQDAYQRYYTFASHDSTRAH